MAKVVKKTPAAPVKKAAAPRKAKVSATVSIDKVCEQALEKLKALKVDQQLQADIAWCLGSFGYDKNPVGLYQIGAKALDALQTAKKKNAKAVPAKLITDLTTALKKA